MNKRNLKVVTGIVTAIHLLKASKSKKRQEHLLQNESIPQAMRVNRGLVTFPIQKVLSRSFSGIGDRLVTAGCNISKALADFMNLPEPSSIYCFWN
ncbi:MAG: hypothetical protein C5B59_07830 [Bacteroidetes bacterium]|nr:MAG: hypothetical protein C5B59_07830 [Bacteroidota bacterium]